jgi:hypothetical protein
MADDHAGWHRLLLDLAGRIPDSRLAAARAQLSESGPAQAAHTVAQAVHRRLPLTVAEADALLAELPPGNMANRVRVAPRQAMPVGPAYPFAPSRTDIGRSFAGGPALMLDLTGEQAGLRPLAADETDDDALTAIAETTNLEGLIGCWRAWRGPAPGTSGPAVRVYLLEVDLPPDDLPWVTAQIQGALAAGGVRHPQVEVYHHGWELPGYHRTARASAALLWAAVPAGPIELARVFDSVDDTTGPAFDPDHPSVADDAERDRALAYLRSGAVLMTTTDRMVDILAPDRGAVVPMTYRTDGTWIWTDTVAYYLREHGLAPDAALYEHMRETGFRAPSVDTVAEHRTLSYLLNAAA